MNTPFAQVGDVIAETFLSRAWNFLGNIWNAWKGTIISSTIFTIIGVAAQWGVNKATNDALTAEIARLQNLTYQTNLNAAALIKNSTEHMNLNFKLLQAQMDMTSVLTKLGFDIPSMRKQATHFLNRAEEIRDLRKMAIKDGFIPFHEADLDFWRAVRESLPEGTLFRPEETGARVSYDPKTASIFVYDDTLCFGTTSNPDSTVQEEQQQEQALGLAAVTHRPPLVPVSPTVFKESATQRTTELDLEPFRNHTANIHRDFSQSNRPVISGNSGFSGETVALIVVAILAVLVLLFCLCICLNLKRVIQIAQRLTASATAPPPPPPATHITVQQLPTVSAGSSAEPSAPSLPTKVEGRSEAPPYTYSLQQQSQSNSREVLPPYPPQDGHSLMSRTEQPLSMDPPRLFYSTRAPEPDFRQAFG